MPTAGELALLMTAKDQISKVLQKVQGETEKTEGSFNKLGSFLKGAFVVGTAAAGAAIAGTAAFLYSAGKAAAEEEVGILKLATAVNASGGSWDQVGGKIEAYVAAQQKRTAFDDGVVREGLQSMIQVTGSYEEAMAALPIVMDLARAKGMDLATAGQLVGRALEGQTGALSRYGIKLEEGATKAQVLAALESKFAGQSEAYASTYMGKMELFQGQMGNLKETIGGLVLPVMTQVAGKFAEFATAAIPKVEAAVARLQPFFNTFFSTLGGGIGKIQALIQGGASLGSILTNALSIGLNAVGISGTPAIAILQRLTPIFTTISTFITGTLIPTIQNVATWIGTNLPVAIAAASSFWTNTLLPAITQIYQFTTGTLIPTLSSLLTWVGANLPGAIQTLSNFWTNTLKPALDMIWGFVANTLIPKLGDLLTWIATNLPPAIQTLADFWTNTLQPALNDVWTFIQNSVIPILSDVWDWIATNLPPVIQTLADFWNQTLLPAIKDVWAFIQDPLMPILSALANLADAVLGLALRTLTDIWNNILLPAIKDVWTFLDKDVMPLFRTAADFLNNTLSKAFESLGSWVGKAVGPIRDIGGAVDSAIGFINRLADTIRNIPGLPSWLTPGSPTPFELGLIGISDALPAVVSWLGSLGGTINALSSDASGGGALMGLPLLSEDDEGTTDSMKRWSDRLRAAVGIIGGASDLASEILKARDTMGQLTNSLEGLYAHVLDEYIPVIRGVLRAFKYHLPRLYDEGLDESLQLWADRLRASVGIITGAADVARAILDGMDVMGRISNHLEGLYAHILDEYIPVIRGVLRAFKYELPRVYDEGLDESIQIWADRLAASVGLITSAYNVAAEILNGMNIMGQITDSLEGLYAHIKDEYIPVIRAVVRAFKYDLPMAFGEDLDDSITRWSDRMGASIGLIANSVNVVREILAGMNTMGQITDSLEGLYAHIHDEYVPVIRAVIRAFKYDLPMAFGDDLDESVARWGDRMGASIGLIANSVGVVKEILDGMDTMGKVTNNLEELYQYIKTEYVPVIRAIIRAFKYDLPMAVGPEINTSMELTAGRLGSALEMIVKTTDIGRALSELSWRKISKAQVDSFVANLGNVMLWLNDPKTGLSSLKGLSGSAARYSQTVGHITQMVISLVDAFRAIGTLPQNIFPQARWDQLNIAITSLVSALKIAAMANLPQLFKIGASMGEQIIAGLNFALSSGGMSLGLPAGGALPVGTGGGMTITHNVNVTVKVEGGMVIASDADRTTFARNITPAIVSEIARGGYSTATDPNAWRPPHR